MLATGALLVSIALLTLATVAPVFRSSNPPRWTTRGWVGEVVTLAIVCTLAVGLGYLGAGLIGIWQTGLDYLDLGLLAAVLLVAVVIWRKRRARRTAPAAEASVPSCTPAAEDVRTGGRAVTAAQAPVTANQPPRPHRAA